MTPARTLLLSHHLSTELLEEIIDHVWDEPDVLDFWRDYGEEYSTLCALSLSCRALRWRSQYHLLHRVSILKMSHLRSLNTLLDEHPQRASCVLHLVVLSTTERPSPAESFAPILGGRLPNLMLLRIRTEFNRADDFEIGPTLSLHRAALACLGKFQSITQLQLLGVRFAMLSEFLRLVHALRRHLAVLQCIQIWFRNNSRALECVDLFRPDSRVPLRSLDVRTCRLTLPYFFDAPLG